MANKTSAELTELNAEMLEKRKKEWLDKAREAEKSLSDSEAELKALQKKIAEQKRTISRAKKYVRMQCEKNFFNTVLKKLELVQEEKNCKTESDYKKLLKKILEQLNLVDIVSDGEDVSKEQSADEVDIVKETPTDEVKLKYPLGEVEDEYENGVSTPGSYKSVKDRQNGAK